MIQHEFITLSLAQFGQILKIPYNGQAVFTNEWDLASLAFFKETDGPYHTNLSTPDEIHRFIQLERTESNRTIKSKNVILTPNQILTKELRHDMKRWEELIRENRIESARATSTANLSYGMFLTRLFQYVMEYYPHLDNDIYNVVDRVMHPLALKQTRKPLSDRGMPKAHHSVSSSSAHHFGSSSYYESDEKDEGTSQARTPSSTTYLNSLQPLTHQSYNIPTFSQQTDDLLFERQTTLLNRQQQMHEEIRDDTKTPSPTHHHSSPSTPNAPSKTPSTRATSSSSIASKLKSPFSSSSPSTNSYLNSSRPTQGSEPIDITLTLSPITPLDIQFNTPSSSMPSSPLFGHPISWNLLEAHGATCLCCIHNRRLILGLSGELQYMFSYIQHMLSQPPPPNSPPPPSISPN
ncbi:hypothetical protein Tco_1010009 [Tanacetum coccineum]